ncbi:MAG: peptide deformylase [Planctomycetia bacterium]
MADDSKLQIIHYPHPTLRHHSKPLRRVDAQLRDWAQQMLDLMYAYNGVGLAGNQVDLPYRIFAMNPEAASGSREHEMILLNPVIVKRSGMAEGEEGCLSFPEIYAPVKRPNKIIVEAYTLDGEELSMELDGFFARVIQHELDHLDGVTFIDRLSTAAKLSVRDQLETLEHQFRAGQETGRIPSNEAIEERLKRLEEERT